MKLTHARIRNFRCILDTKKFSINKLCCLVGKNEAGKTAALTALQSILPFGKPQTNFDKTEDYPRRYLSQYSTRHPDGRAPVVDTWWKLDGDAYKLLCEEFGEEAIKSKKVKISRTYDNPETIWRLKLDSSLALKYVFSKYKLNASENQILAKCTTVEETLNVIRRKEVVKPKLEAIASYLETCSNSSLHDKAVEILNPLVPEFFYTSHYDRMNGQISVHQVQRDQSENNVNSGDKIF
ncbi:MAG: AAA family ATPase [Gammaproteobacteria bacterium]|nr:AAA family ATPase [Gammaproteobacteria bacterium]